MHQDLIHSYIEQGTESVQVVDGRKALASLPLVDGTFGVAATAKNEDKKQNGGGGMGGKMSPSAVLVIQNGTTKLVNVKNQDGLTKILDMVPDFVNKFTDGKFFSSKDDDEIISEAKEEKE